MSEHSEALRLADAIEQLSYLTKVSYEEAANELRRLHEVNRELYEALEDMHRTQLNNNMHDPDDYENTEQFLRVTAALAKALGEG